MAEKRKWKVAEVKKELGRLAMEIVGNDELSFDIIDRSVEVLESLRNWKLKAASSSSEIAVPEEFMCPISHKLIKDPVVLATGHTCDRRFIQKWLKEGRRICPQSQEVLSHTLLIPNVVVKQLIANWCEENGVEGSNQPPDSDDDTREVELSTFDRAHLDIMLAKLSSSSLQDQKLAAKDLRSLTKRLPSFRTLFGERSEAIAQMLTPLTLGNLDAIDPDLHVDLVTSLLNLSIKENGKKLVGEYPMVIPLLIESLRCGIIEARSNAAAALFTLSALDSNKQLIVEAGGMRALIELLQEGHPLAMKDVASAVYSLCGQKEMQGRAIGDGLIGVILQKINDGIFVDELLVILAMLAKNRQALEELGKLGAIRTLLSVIRETNVMRIQENAVLTLHSMCIHDKRRLKEIKDDKEANETINIVAVAGSPRAIRKANEILNRLEAAYRGSCTA